METLLKKMSGYIPMKPILKGSQKDRTKDLCIAVLMQWKIFLRKAQDRPIKATVLPRTGTKEDDRTYSLYMPASIPVIDNGQTPRTGRDINLFLGRGLLRRPTEEQGQTRPATKCRSWGRTG